MARKKLSVVVEEPAPKVADFTIQSLSKMVLSISYTNDKGQVDAFSLQQYSEKSISEKYRSQFIKFVNQGLIKIL